MLKGRTGGPVSGTCSVHMPRRSRRSCRGTAPFGAGTLSGVGSTSMPGTPPAPHSCQAGPGQRRATVDVAVCELKGSGRRATAWNSRPSQRPPAPSGSSHPSALSKRGCRASACPEAAGTGHGPGHWFLWPTPCIPPVLLVACYGHRPKHAVMEHGPIRPPSFKMRRSQQKSDPLV